MSVDDNSIDNFEEAYVAEVPTSGKRPWLPNAIGCLILGGISIVAGLFQFANPQLLRPLQISYLSHACKDRARLIA